METARGAGRQRLEKGPEGSAERGQEDRDGKPTDVKKYRSRLGGKVLWEGRGTRKKKTTGRDQ